VTQDDLLYRFRLGAFALAGELGNVRAACRAMGIHLHLLSLEAATGRYGPEILRPGSGGCRAWRIRPACWSSSGWSPSPWATPALGRPGSPPNSPNPLGAIQLSTNGCGGCWAAMA
jgi:hypothetical protein